MQQLTPSQKSREEIVPVVSYVDVVPQLESQPSISDWICERPLYRRSRFPAQPCRRL